MLPAKPVAPQPSTKGRESSTHPAMPPATLFGARRADAARNVRELKPQLRGGSVVVTENSTDTLAPANGTAGTLPWQVIDQLVAQPLMVSFAIVVCHELGEGSPQVPFTEGDHAIEAFLLDRTHEPLRMRIAVRRQERGPNHSDACRCEEALYGGAPLSIAVADQQVIPGEHAIDIVGKPAHRFDDERRVRVWCSAENMDPT
jgi:hypothetical protein